MSEQIKQCPFCGGDMNITVCDDPDSRYWIKCYTCGSTGPVSITKNDAILLWNAAANALEQKDAEIARLVEACDDLEGEYLRMKEQRDEARKVARRLYRDSQLKDGDIIRLCEELATRNEARKVAKHWYKTAQEYKKEFGSLPEDDDDVLIDSAKSKEYYIATYTRTEPQSIRVTATSDDDN